MGSFPKNLQINLLQENLQVMWPEMQSHLVKSSCTVEQWNMFYRRIPIKDLRCGVLKKL